MILTPESVANFVLDHGAAVLVEIARVRGSSPREEGAFMLVAERSVLGTIGGGQLEYMAADEARSLLRRGEAAQRMDVPLGPEIGQCCGGRVEISLTLLDETGHARLLERVRDQREADPQVLIFGAGHVGRALAGIMAMLPVRTILIDGREEELALAPDGVETRLTPLPEAEIAKAPAGSAYLVMTHDHALDFLIAADALRRSDTAYVGMIGSQTKRKSFENWCRRHAEPPVDPAGLVCPVGTLKVGATNSGDGSRKSGDKRPEVIATFVAAEIMASISMAATAEFVGEME